MKSTEDMDSFQDNLSARNTKTSENLYTIRVIAPNISGKLCTGQEQLIKIKQMQWK